jgi:hypothetical protein
MDTDKDVSANFAKIRVIRGEGFYPWFELCSVAE